MVFGRKITECRRHGVREMSNLIGCRRQIRAMNYEFNTVHTRATLLLQQLFVFFSFHYAVIFTIVIET